MEKIKIGDKVKFNSGNFIGLTGIITKVNFNSNSKKAMFGYLHEVKLSNNKTGFIEKSEHYKIVKS
jgi:transcription antitermination factor NusG